MIHCFGNKYQTSGISFSNEEAAYPSKNTIEIFYMISGRAHIQIEDTVYKMGQGDIILINFEEESIFTPQASSVPFFVRASLANELFYDNTDLFFPQFECNSMTAPDKISYTRIRANLEKLIEEAISMKTENQFKLYETGYAFLNCLVKSCLVEAKGQNVNSQFQKILVFIQENAKTDLPLTKVAEHFYMNSSYLSRYFKKQQGVGFQEYLTNYRLQLAENELVFSGKTISVIALDNGFKNVNVFMKHFKTKHGISPKEFREKNGQFAHQREHLSEEEFTFLENWLRSSRKEIPNQNYYEIDYRRNEKKQTLPAHLINLGSAADLLQSDYRKQIRFLKKELDFQYGRIWNIFVEEMNVDVTRIKDVNFDRIDSILDFLLELEIKPFFELSYKIRRIYKNVKLSETPLLSKPSYEIINDDWKNLLSVFIEHAERRYGHKEISQWHFELTRDEKDLDEYIAQYQTTYKILKNNNKKIKVGGAGFKYNFDQIPFKEELAYFEKKQLKFDFLSFMSFPYERTDKSQRHSKRVTDPNFLKNMLAAIHATKRETCYCEVPIYLTEWGNTISSRNRTNDTVYRGAYIIKELIEMIGEVDLIGYWISSDLYSNFVDSKQLLNGGSGILNKNGIPKPVFFAIRFLMSMSNNIVFIKEDCLVSVRNGSRIQILLHNAKLFNYRYFLIPENEITYSEIADMFLETEKRTMLLKLLNLPQKKWQIKVNEISEGHGNLLQEWENIGFGSDLGREETEYLNRITIPKLTFYDDSSAEITLKRELTPNEFCLIEMVKR